MMRNKKAAAIAFLFAVLLVALKPELFATSMFMAKDGTIKLTGPSALTREDLPPDQAVPRPP